MFDIKSLSHLTAVPPVLSAVSTPYVVWEGVQSSAATTALDCTYSA
jgi:hypothetical protein